MVVNQVLILGLFLFSLVLGQVMFSYPSGFQNLNSVPTYEYGPSVILEDGTYYQFYCSPGANGAWDYIRLSTSKDGNSWTEPVIALTPANDYDRDSVCDPSIVKYRGVYLLYHTCINTRNPSDGYKNNRICLSTADKITGPYHTYSKPVIEDLTCTSDPSKAYCVGQPSAVALSDRNQVFVFYTNQKGGEPGPNVGYVELAVSNDGVTFTKLTNHTNPSFSQRDVDVKWDRRGQRFIMFQGDVGSKNITWSVSPNGISFLPYDGSRNVQTNPNLPSGGTNNNPGIAGLPDGTVGAASSWVAYGSSYQAGWGDWHLYRTDFVLDPDQNDCHRCAYGGHCDFACTATLGSTTMGYCAYPGSTDQAKCCSCEPFPPQADCHLCEPVGCVAGCLGAGYEIGVCGSPGGTNPNNCCSCFK
eukprot:TRINITY_DN2182_c0_g1_i1.p1 TRINITY_DN2182_c0_g1~~TRINITY_DN2182_c0_g1_i1.p1  ORF type:complete len:415 (-),score=68.69 TRINITY_DN2182_c0_g1_i1:93-1337(-)